MDGLTFVAKVVGRGVSFNEDDVDASLVFGGGARIDGGDTFFFLGGGVSSCGGGASLVLGGVGSFCVRGDSLVLVGSLDELSQA